MKIYKIAKYYSVNRDDSELRVVICPKCKDIDIEGTDEIIALSGEDSPLKLCKCNKCKAYFSFYMEDGVREITKEEATKGKKDGHIDLIDKGKNKGKDQHGHCYYVTFTDKPKTISRQEYEKMRDGDYDEFKSWKKRNCISLNLLVNLKDVVSKIDWDCL